MTSASPTQFHVYLPQVNACLAQCLNSVFNVKGESASRRRLKQGGAFSVTVKLQSALRLAFSSTSLAIQLQEGEVTWNCCYYLLVSLSSLSVHQILETSKHISNVSNVPSIVCIHVSRTCGCGCPNHKVYLPGGAVSLDNLTVF